MRVNMTLPKLLLLLAEVITFAVLAVVSSSDFGLADGACITLGYLVAYVVPRIVLARSRGSSTTASVILLVLVALLMLAGVSNLLEWTRVEGYSLEMPNLKSDARGYYKWALSHYDGRVESPDVVFPGYPLMLVCLWRVLGVSVVWPLALNTMFVLISVVLTGLTTRRLLIHRTSMSASALVSCGMLLTCLLFFYLMMGISILKEGSVFLSMSLVGYALSSMSAADEERHRPWKDLLLFVVGCLLLGMVRTTYLYILLIGVVIMVIPHWRRDWVMALAMVAIIVVAMLAGNHYASYSFDRHVEIMGGGWNMQRFYIRRGTHTHYRELLDYYYLYSPLHRVVMLPLTSAVQFMIPFPWSAGEGSNLAYFICRITYGWYLVGGIALFYYLFIGWRRNENMGAWPLWPAAVFVALAYVMAGTVNRYLLPVEPMFVPVAVYVLSRVGEARWRRLFKRWSIVFVIVIAITLLLCLEMERETFSSALHTQSLHDFLRERF